MQNELTPLAQKIIDIIQQEPGWVNRKTIARKLRRSGNRLYDHDVDTLARLVEAGYLEAQTPVVQGAVKTEYQYRVATARQNNTRAK